MEDMSYCEVLDKYKEIFSLLQTIYYSDNREEVLLTNLRMYSGLIRNITGEGIENFKQHPNEEKF